MVHRRRGPVSNRRRPEALRNALLERYRERCDGFGPTLATEELAKDGLVVDHKTLRRWLLESGDCGRSPAAGASTAPGGSGAGGSANGCSWTAATTPGSALTTGATAR